MDTSDLRLFPLDWRGLCELLRFARGNEVRAWLERTYGCGSVGSVGRDAADALFHPNIVHFILFGRAFCWIISTIVFGN